MGYRSDVRIVTTNKGYDELKKYTDNYLKDNNFKYDNLLEACDLFEENKYSKYFGWNNIKWYERCEGYEDIDAIMSGLDHLRNNDMSFRYARIGESYDDYEEDSYESSIEEEQDLDYPYMYRGFDDEYIIHNMDRVDKINEMEV